jgi:hypothetical protein
VEGVSD